jgi:rRNA maturation RNase YbeY
MLDSENQPPSELDVLITMSEEIADLNFRFRGMNEPTDVLSFPSTNFKPHLGDIAINLEQAERQALEHKIDLMDELCCLAVHGGLHLLGFDHKTPAQEREMHRKMNAALALAGLRQVEGWSSEAH